MILWRHMMRCCCRLSSSKQNKVYLPESPFPHAEVCMHFKSQGAHALRTRSLWMCVYGCIVLDSGFFVSCGKGGHHIEKLSAIESIDLVDCSAWWRYSQYKNVLLHCLIGCSWSRITVWNTTAAFMVSCSYMHMYMACTWRVVLFYLWDCLSLVHCVCVYTPMCVLQHDCA